MLGFRPTLERKFIALASAIILVCSFVANIVIVNLYRNQLFQQARVRAHLLTESVAISFTNTLLYQELGLVEERGLLENYIEGMVSDPMTGIVDVTVYGLDGKILATNDYDQYFSQPAPEITRRLRTLPHAEVTARQGDDTFEVYFPLRIKTKRFGLVRVRFSLQPELKVVAGFKRWMFWATIAFALVGVLIAFVVARTLARPIKELAGEMAKVEAPTYVADIPGKRQDEIGDLERSFVEMLQRLKAAAEERERQQKALIQTEKLASVGTLVSGLAHEINNPLAGIRNCLRRIMAKPEDAAQSAKYARLMDDALRRIENIIRDLLSFSRKRETAFQPVDLNEIVSAAVALVKLRFKKHEVRLQLRLAKKLPEILGDAHHLEQVVVNLLLNAVDATPSGGEIEVATRATEQEVIIEVTDTGKGIPKELQHKIFDPFFTTKPVGQGTGLGLAVTKAIVEDHLGKIDFTSGAFGTIFRVSLPRAQDGAAPKTTPSLSAAILAGGRSSRMGRDKALLPVDGKPMIARVLEIVRQQTQNVMVISNQPDSYAFLKVPVYPDAVESCGPLAGIYTALRHSSTQQCLVVACDLPFLSRALLQFMCENAVSYDVFAFESQSGVEPLCAVYAKSCLPVIEAQMEKGDFKVSNFYDQVNTRIVRLEPGRLFFDEKAFFNVNTPEELARARELVQQNKTEVK
ncbi:MAG: HAMP domain-containing protein [Calditrichaeota bacterium]|nr:MAG: HAMP domain-containing protein [Calditrichota bacterium]